VLGASGSPEEALLKRCSHFDLSSATNSAQAACLTVVELREEQLEDCKTELGLSVRKAEALLQVIRESELLQGVPDKDKLGVGREVRPHPVPKHKHIPSPRACARCILPPDVPCQHRPDTLTRV
jgi:hypothetical protein